MSNIKERLGLQFLKRGPREAESAAEPSSFMREAVLLYSGRIVEFLEGAPERKAPLLEVVKAKTIPIDVALKVVEVLEREGVIEVVAREPLTGNHVIRLLRARPSAA